MQDDQGQPPLTVTWTTWKKPGEAIPVVNARDLKVAWDVMQEFPGKAVGTAVWAGECTPGADIRAVACRAGFLLGMPTEMVPKMTGQDPLAPWHRGKEIDDAVLRAAAKFPFTWPGTGVSTNLPPFDLDAFLQLIRNEKEDETNA